MKIRVTKSLETDLRLGAQLLCQLVQLEPGEGRVVREVGVAHLRPQTLRVVLVVRWGRTGRGQSQIEVHIP